MTRKVLNNSPLVFLIATLFLVGILFSASTARADDEDSGDILATLSKELKLSEEQIKKLGPAIQKFVNTVDGLKTEQEKEDAEPDALVKGVKNAQEEFNGQLKEIFTSEQFKQYEAMKEKAIKGMFNDLAEIQIMDLQPKVGFNDEQLTQLAPILGGSLYQMVTIAWDHAGKRMRPAQKIKLAKNLKHIQKESRDSISKILTPEQLQTWDKLKEQAKNSK